MFKTKLDVDSIVSPITGIRDDLRKYAAATAAKAQRLRDEADALNAAAIAADCEADRANRNADQLDLLVL